MTIYLIKATFAILTQFNNRGGKIKKIFIHLQCNLLIAVTTDISS